MDRGIGNISNTPECGGGAFVDGYRDEKVGLEKIDTMDSPYHSSVVKITAVQIDAFSHRVLEPLNLKNSQ